MNSANALHHFISRKEDDMTTQHHQVIPKMLVSGAIALGALVVGVAPASADPNSPANPPNPFGGLTCSCQKIARPASRQALTQQIDRGIRDGLSGSPGV
jgi:hypothetical protein